MPNKAAESWSGAWCLGAFALLAVVAVSAATADERAAAPAKGGDLDAEAMAILVRSVRQLRALPAFRVHAEVTQDEVVDDDFKLQRTSSVRIAVLRPDRMRVEVSGDRGKQLFIYDGQKLTIYVHGGNYYGSVRAPATLRETLDAIVERYGIELPLLDVIYVAMGGELKVNLRAAGKIGTSTVAGIRCDQLAFRGANVDWQLWVEAGAMPVPRKLVITTRDAGTRPQYGAVMHWEVAPTLREEQFTFSPPAGALPIALGLYESKPRAPRTGKAPLPPAQATPPQEP